MSKYIIRDDDLIEILDVLIQCALDNDDSKADYVSEKLCVLSGRDYQEYVNLYVELQND